MKAARLAPMREVSVQVARVRHKARACVEAAASQCAALWRGRTRVDARAAYVSLCAACARCGACAILLRAASVSLRTATRVANIDAQQCAR